MVFSSTEFKGFDSHEFSYELRHRGRRLEDDGEIPVTIEEELENGTKSQTSTSVSASPCSSANGDQEQKKGEAENGGKGEKSAQEEEEELNPWSRPYIGIPINYVSVGLIYAGSLAILYPVLVIQQGVTSSFFAAASSLVVVFWSYKIFFGLLCDCTPIMGRKWKPYIILGWVICAAMLIALGCMGTDVSATTLVIMLTVSNLGYVMADVAADGYMVWMAHRESDHKKGRIQTLIYIIREIGRISINIVVLLPSN